MKLILAVIQTEDQDALTAAVQAEGLSVTRLGSSGGFLRAYNVTLMMAVEDHQVERALALLGKHCRRRTQHLRSWSPGAEARERFPGAIPIQVGGASVFIFHLERMERIG